MPIGPPLLVLQNKSHMIHEPSSGLAGLEAAWPLSSTIPFMPYGLAGIIVFELCLTAIFVAIATLTTLPFKNHILGHHGKDFDVEAWIVLGVGFCLISAIIFSISMLSTTTSGKLTDLHIVFAVMVYGYRFLRLWWYKTHYEEYTRDHGMFRDFTFPRVNSGR